MDAIVNSLVYNSISILAAFIVTFNLIPIFAPVYTTMSTRKRTLWTIVFAFVLFANFSQAFNSDMLLWCPIAALAGLVTSYFRFRIAPKKPE